MKFKNIYQQVMLQKITIENELKTKAISELQWLITHKKDDLSFEGMLDLAIPASIKACVHLCLPDQNDKIFKGFFYRGPDFDFFGDSPEQLDEKTHRTLINFFSLCLILGCTAPDDLSRDFEETFDYFIVIYDDMINYIFRCYDKDDFSRWVEYHVFKYDAPDYTIEKAEHVFKWQEIEDVSSRGKGGCFYGYHSNIIVNANFIRKIQKHLEEDELY